MLALRRTFNDPNRCQDVVSRRLVFCEAAECMPTEHLLLDCWHCGRFLAYCCACTERRRLSEEAKGRQRRRSPSPSESSSAEPPKPCHYYKVAFVDGACLGNGRDGATAGIGIAIGVNPLTMQWAIPVDDEIDPCHLRTSQRAELLAAIYGVRKLSEFQRCHGRDEEHEGSAGKITWVITSDSEYVVSGMTEWVPSWKSKGWRNSSGRRPKNLDLFQRLDVAVDNHEREHGVRIAFWRISRDHNELADLLAGVAAQGQMIEPVQFEPMYPQSEDEMETD